jgi:hypothetical protein
MDEEHKRKLTAGRKKAAAKRHKQNVKAVTEYMDWWRAFNKIWADKKCGRITEEEYRQRNLELNGENGSNIPPIPSAGAWASYEVEYGDS